MRWSRFCRSTARRSTLRDFAEYFARIEEPAKTTYRGYTVYKHGFGSQGPVLLQALNILENFDLQRWVTPAPTTCIRSSKR